MGVREVAHELIADARSTPDVGQERLLLTGVEDAHVQRDDDLLVGLGGAAVGASARISNHDRRGGKGSVDAGHPVPGRPRPPPAVDPDGRRDVTSCQPEEDVALVRADLEHSSPPSDGR